MPKKDKRRPSKQVQGDTHDREAKILNIMCNTSILLMAMMTEAFSGVFTEMAAGMAQAVTTGFGATEKNSTDTKNIERVKTELPKQMIEQVVQMKADMSTQLQEKKKK